VVRQDITQTHWVFSHFSHFSDTAMVAVLVFTSKSLLIIRYELNHYHVDEFFIRLDEEF
jgi:hypothetical protein